SWLQPNRSPLGAWRSNSSVSGRRPAGPGTVGRTSKRDGSLSTREAKGGAAAVMGNLTVAESARVGRWVGYRRKGNGSALGGVTPGPAPTGGDPGLEDSPGVVGPGVVIPPTQSARTPPTTGGRARGGTWRRRRCGQPGGRGSRRGRRGPAMRGRAG